jgi:hypothetical protein
LDSATYHRLAHCALRVADYANIQPAIIRKLRDRGGCELVLYGRQNAYTLRMETAATPARIAVYYLPLDSRLSGPGCELFRGYDCFADWHKMTDVMIWREAELGAEQAQRDRFVSGFVGGDMDHPPNTLKRKNEI